MKVLKIIGITLGVLLAILLILGAMAPKKMTAERSLTINAPLDLVFNTVNDLSSWESWSPWKEMDPTMKVTMGEITTGTGASYTWAAENAGSGKMTITSSKPTSEIETNIEFDGMGSSTGDFQFENAENGTKVTWGFEGGIPFPLNAFLLFQDAEGAIGKDFERGLEKLKEVVEAKKEEMSKAAFDIQQVDLPVRYYVGVRETMSMDKLTERLAENLPKVFKALADNKIEVAGMPSGLYYTWDEAKKETDVLMGAPTTKKVDVDAFTTIELPAGKGLLIDYYGPYENLGAAHMAMEEYLNNNNLKAGLPAIEEYVTDPGTESDPNKWLTKVYYSLE